MEPIPDAHKIHYVDLNPRGDPPEDSLTPMEEIMTIMIWPKEYKTTQIRMIHLKDEEIEIV